MRFSELVKLLERNGFTLVREKGSIRYYSKPGHDKIIRVDYHGSKVKSPPGRVVRFLKQLELEVHDDRLKVLFNHRGYC